MKIAKDVRLQRFVNKLAAKPAQVGTIAVNAFLNVPMCCDGVCKFCDWLVFALGSPAKMQFVVIAHFAFLHRG